MLPILFGSSFLEPFSPSLPDAKFYLIHIPCLLDDALVGVNRDMLQFHWQDN